MYTPPVHLDMPQIFPPDVITQFHDEWLYLSLISIPPLEDRYYIYIYISFSPFELVAPLLLTLPIYTSIYTCKSR